ncbi:MULTISPECIES: tripartite tricarboxylate transporter substrate binding protein [unclassified Beijerinckia]|uniref:Bug family tripartite tricarboxylate transporter substrate binding protein n=1 Tax=unclassified Beijerinckia TaxID=2638183 RepID=UPI00089ABCCA|nr:MULTISPECIES: tripartite tricarboxylate transporter substrate binding protein [unclassified Beijerinckia]MDH7795337.1 tripartite-type tricarboxylate transporter receptor subunit TctC [Beijerinckia sp. GAS462]SEB97345.1 Tripartite-type tricarboxylate transporter, receptor component TctC [Beijerinckia sp. 28-YEA-48]
MFDRRKFLLACPAIAVSSLSAFEAAEAQSYPNKIIRIIGPAPPGGMVDIIARIVAPQLQDAFKQNVIVENRGGGGGYLGTEQLSRAAPDGYTLGIGGGFSTITATLQKAPSYNPRDLIPIAVFGGTPNMLIVSPKVKARSFAELLADAKANPGKYNVGSNGLGTTIHLTAELFKQRTGTQITHIAYRGQPEAMNALMSGETDMMFDTASIHVANVKEAKIRAFGIAGPNRFKPLPDVPTLAEGGVEGVEVLSWFGLMAPKGTPPEVVTTLDTALKSIVAKPEFQRAVIEQGLEPMTMNATQAQAFWRSEIDKWSAVIKAGNMQQ